jgi:hypothetical protein
MYNNIMINAVKEHPSSISKKYILNVNDRCDKCQVQAVIKVKGISGELTFCGHHYEKIMNNPESHNKMMAFMLEVLDEREKLNQTKPIGAI